jgi:hypothetical protein
MDQSERNGQAMPEHRVPRRRLELAGAMLVISTTNGFSVIHDGDYIGYIHASIGNQWNAYRRREDRGDDHLGRFTQDEAVRSIMQACGRARQGKAA